MGSSAALSVSLAAALIALSDSVRMGFSQKGWLQFGERELDLVNKWAFEGEKILHGKPSGIDNSVSTYGMCLADHMVDKFYLFLPNVSSKHFSAICVLSVS